MNILYKEFPKEILQAFTMEFKKVQEIAVKIFKGSWWTNSNLITEEIPITLPKEFSRKSS